MARRATRNAQQEIYRLYFGAFERDMLGKGGGINVEYQSFTCKKNQMVDYTKVVQCKWNWTLNWIIVY